MVCKGILKNLSLDWNTKKPEITLQLDAKTDFIEKLKEKVLSVELKQYREKRSLDANAYYWKLLTELADKIGQSNAWMHNNMLRKYGQIETIDGKIVYMVIPDTDAAYNKAYEAQEYHIKPTSQVKEGKDGMMYRTYIMLKGSSSYNTKEMSQLIEGLVRECKDVGIETMTPEEIKRMMDLYKKNN